MKRSIIVLCTLAVIALGSIFFFQTQGQIIGINPPHSNDATATNATVSFGGWMTDQPLDRFPNNNATQFPITRNHHRLTPRIATIKAGGTVNFIIGGFHVVTVYDDGTQPQDINTSLLTTPQGQPAPPIINDPNRRIYRGLDPSILPPKAQQDRVEVVNFDHPGTFLVICSVLPHFQEGMYGFVVVTPNDLPH
jgi:plastocyanin